jgi:hypothetical protein
MYIRPATPEEVLAFHKAPSDARGAESDHQDEYVAATALVTPAGLVVATTHHDDSTRYWHVTAAWVEEWDFFINFRRQLPFDPTPEDEPLGSTAPFSQQKCEEIMSSPPDYAFGHEDSDKVLQVWNVAGGLLVDLGGLDTWFVKATS